MIVLNGYNLSLTTGAWGSGKRVSADGTQWNTYERNLKRRGPTRGKNKRTGDPAEIRSELGNAAQQFAIALFAGIDRQAVEQRTVSLAELRQMLSLFEILDDRRHSRRWSPTQYADGVTSRGDEACSSCDCVPRAA